MWFVEMFYILGNVDTALELVLDVTQQCFDVDDLSLHQLDAVMNTGPHCIAGNSGSSQASFRILSIHEITTKEEG